MPDPMLMARAIVAAWAVALVTTLLASRLWRTTRPNVASAGNALAIGLAWLTASWVLNLVPQFPPREDQDRLLFVLLPAAIIAELIAVAATRAGWIARGIVTVLATPILLHGTSFIKDLAGPGTREWSPLQTGLIFAALALLLATAWVLLDRLATRTESRTPLVGLTIAAGGAALVVMLSGYLKAGQVGLGLAAGLAGVALGSLARREKPAIHGALGVGVVGLFALLAAGHLFAGLTLLNAFLLFLAPLLGWLPEMIPASPRLRGTLCLALTTAPVIAALILAQQKFAADSKRPSSSPNEISSDYYLNPGK